MITGEFKIMVYLVAQIRALAKPIDGYPIDTPQIMEITGVFNSMDKAAKACRDWTYFVVGPIPMNESSPHETVPDHWPSWFPIERPDGVWLPGEERPLD